MCFKTTKNIDLFYSVKSDDGTEPEKLVHPKVFRQLKRNWMIYRFSFFVFFLITMGNSSVERKRKTPTQFRSHDLCSFAGTSIGVPMEITRNTSVSLLEEDWWSCFLPLLTTACRLKWFIGNVLPTRVSSSSFENQQQKRKNRLLHSLGQRLTHTHTH